MKVQWNIKFIDTSMSSSTHRVDKSKHKNFLESPHVLNICLLNHYKKDIVTSATCIELNFLFHWLQILVFTFQMGSKWHQLLALEVQDPEKKNFSSSDLKWNMVEGNYVAWIKSDRVNELVTGECKNPLYPTSFRKCYSSKREKEKEKMEIKFVELSTP